jgi:membrane protein implicated in regulation of membrane protease activity
VASALAFLFGWGNAPFAIAAGVVVVYALLQVTGILGVLAGASDHDHEFGDAAHGGEPTGEGGDADAQADADADADANTDANTDHQGGGRASIGAFLGFGTLPSSMIWQTFALVAAATGYALNFGYLGRPGGPPLVTLVWTLPAAASAGAVAVSLVARSLAPVFASKAQEATRRADLVGHLGVVISSRVSEEFGEIRIRDKSGHDLRVVCKLARGARIAPREHTRVVVVDQDERGALIVEPFDDGTGDASTSAERTSG